LVLLSQVQYSISRPKPAKSGGASSRGRGTRGAAAKQAQAAPQPDGSEVVSFVSQLREYGSEQQELVDSLLTAAGRGPAVPQAAAAVVVEAPPQQQQSAGVAGQPEAGSAEPAVEGLEATEEGVEHLEVSAADGDQHDRPSKRARQEDSDMLGE
jgi:hypothetical protein